MFAKALDIPKTVGYLEPDFLMGLRDEFPEKQLGCEWYRDHDMEGYYPTLMNALQPLNELLLSREVQGFRRKPWGIFYSVATDTIEPGRAQRPGTWHIDGDGRGKSIVVADAMPTQFLAKDPEVPDLDMLKARTWLLRETRRAGLTGLYASEADLLKENGLVVHQPAPYEIVRLEGNIHRSPKNMGEEAVARTWIRATIHQRKP